MRLVLVFSELRLHPPTRPQIQGLKALQRAAFLETSLTQEAG